MKKLYTLLLALFVASACSESKPEPLAAPPVNASVVLIDPSFSTFRFKTYNEVMTFTSIGDGTGSGDYLGVSLLSPGSYPFTYMCTGRDNVYPFYCSQSAGYYCLWNSAYDSVGHGYVDNPAAGLQCEYNQPQDRLIKIQTIYGTKTIVSASVNAGNLTLYDLVNGEPRWLIIPTGETQNRTPAPGGQLYLTSQIIGDTVTAINGVPDSWRITFGPLTKRPSNNTLTSNPAYAVCSWTNTDATAYTEVWFGPWDNMTYRGVAVPGATSYYNPKPWPNWPNNIYRCKTRHKKTGVVLTPDFSFSNTLTLP